MAKGRDAKPHIGVFGRRNYGKSSFINKLANQDIAIVSDIAGTTTDPVKKSFEITGFGPVILIDTAGIDDVGELGEKRIQKTKRIIDSVDLAILLITNNTFEDFEKSLIDEFKKRNTPYFIIHNKSDISDLDEKFRIIIEEKYNCNVIKFNSLSVNNLEEVIENIKLAIPESSYKKASLIGDIISHGDIVLLITPIDVEAPEGRLILPQVQMIRDIIDNDCIAIVLKEREIDSFLRTTNIKPKLAITDSQVFYKADASVPKNIPLTSFSIVLARHKGDFNNYLKGTPKISDLKNGDKVLLLESCSHHVSCDDIGRVKIPRWIRSFTGKELEFKIVAGLDELPDDLNKYALVIQCGGCMITQKQIKNRIKRAVDYNIPVTNYGMAIAYVQGIYERAIEPFINTNKNGLDYL